MLNVFDLLLGFKFNAQRYVLRKSFKVKFCG